MKLELDDVDVSIVLTILKSRRGERQQDRTKLVELHAAPGLLMVCDAAIESIENIINAIESQFYTPNTNTPDREISEIE